MIFRTRKLVKPEDLNPRGTLFGGQLLKWIDEEAAIYCICQLNTPNVVTKVMSEVDFIASARLGDIIEIGCELIKLGTSSITIKCVVRNKDTQRVITAIDKIVFVAVDEQGNPIAHNKTKQ